MSVQKKIVLFLVCIVLIGLVWIRRPQHISSLVGWQDREIAYCAIVKESGNQVVQTRLTEPEDIAALCNILDDDTVSFHFWYDNSMTYDANQDLYWIRIFYFENEASEPISFLENGRVFYHHREYRLHGTDGAVITKALDQWLENVENPDER